MTRHLAAAALIVLAGLSVQGEESRSRSASATMNVSAYVVARTIVTVDDQPRQVMVTDEDVRRGYVELPSAVRFSVRSNARNGYLLEFSRLDPAFERMSLRWEATEVVLGSDGAVISQPAVPGEQQRIADVRLELGRDTRPGVYNWGVQISGGSLN